MIFEYDTNELYETPAQERYPHFAFRTLEDAEFRILAENRCKLKLKYRILQFHIL